jgi:DNA polymerase-1
MKIAMIRVPVALVEAHLSARLILQVHDELVLDCPLAELAQTAALVQRVMAEAYELRVPLQTEARSGHNWGQMTPISQP